MNRRPLEPLGFDTVLEEALALPKSDQCELVRKLAVSISGEDTADRILAQNPTLSPIPISEEELDIPTFLRDRKQAEDAPPVAVPELWIDKGTRAILLVGGVLLVLVALRNLFPNWPFWK